MNNVRNDENENIARFRGDHTTQPLALHNQNVAKLAERNCDLPDMKPICRLAGGVHDTGKYGKFQGYIREKMKNPNSGTVVDHSFAGGWRVSNLQKGNDPSERMLVEMVRHAILCHHGLSDCVDPESREIYYEKREKNAKGENDDNNEKRLAEWNELLRKAEADVPPETLEVWFQDAKTGMCNFQKRMENLLPSDVAKETHSRDFYYGMYFRLLLSYLIDADWTDAACFESGRELPEPESEESVNAFWQDMSAALETKLETLQAEAEDTELNACRAAISQSCRDAAERAENLYRLIVPTGAGKTLAALRFAINHAKAFGKRRFFYIAPFNSILEQNTKVIRDALKTTGREDFLLEHHCNVVPQNAEADEKYRKLTENWDVPMVATSAVQFLNALFFSKSGDIRRLRSLVNSVIVLDEVQALPEKCTCLFNLAMNFLTEFCNTTVVLCSATQPPTDEIERKGVSRMKTPAQMVENPERYFTAFKRTNIQKKNRDASYNIPELAGFVREHWQKLDDPKSALIVVNTKSVARALFQELRERNTDSSLNLFHLSTNMCPAHREKTLQEMRECLRNGRPVLCVSTQLIEAGVDVSFRMVVRSLTGLDHIVQAAGRCNRNGQNDIGNVYVINIDKDLEKVDNLKNIQLGKTVMTKVFHFFEKNPERFQNDLLSPSAMQYYYKCYYNNKEVELDFTLGDSKAVVFLTTNIPRVKETLLSHNILLGQAFRTVGDQFRVIEEGNREGIIVQCAESVALIEELRTCDDIPRQRHLLRQLQKYTVEVFADFFQSKSSSDCLEFLDQAGIHVLKEEYYDPALGILLSE